LSHVEGDLRVDGTNNLDADGSRLPGTPLVPGYTPASSKTGGVEDIARAIALCKPGTALLPISVEEIRLQLALGANIG
jgi:hypothetical protein